MDIDLKLVDVINDPVALNQFLDFPVYESVESHSLDELNPVSTAEDFLNFENCHVEYSSAVIDDTTDVTEWNFSSSGLSDVSSTLIDSSIVSAVDAQTAVPVATLPQGCETVAQSFSLGYISSSARNCNTSQNFVQIQPSRNIADDIKQPTGHSLIVDSSTQRFPNTNKVPTNLAFATSVNNSSFILNSAGSSNDNQMLMNVQPQSVMQNGAVRIQYIQVQNQLPRAMPTGTVLHNFGATQLPTNNLKPVQLRGHQGQQLVAHGVQGGLNMQGTIIPAVAGSHILFRTGSQPIQRDSTGQVNMQPVQICGSNFVGGTQDNRLPQVIEQVTGGQQGIRVQQPQMTTLVERTNAVAGQVIDANLSLSGGRRVILQQPTGATSQNVMYQQQAVTLPVEAIESQENKLPNGLVVQIGSQTYRFEPSQQSTGAANVRHSSVFPQSQNVGFHDGSGVSQDPVKMLQQNVQLQQMLIGNQINVLQMLQKQQQHQQRLQSKVGVQQFTGSQGTGSSNIIVNPLDVVTESNSLVGSVLNQATLACQPLQAQKTVEQTGSDLSLQGNRVALGLKSSLMASSMSQSGLQFIQPKPTVSVGVPSASSSEVVSQPVNVLQLGTTLPLMHLGAQPTMSNANRNIISINIQPSAQVVTTLSGNQLNLKPGILPSPQNIIVGGQTGQSQNVTTVKLSTDQQNLLIKIQSQMKTLLDLPKRNLDQEKYLQMLISGQQRIISQGVSQYLQQQKTVGVKVESGALGGSQPQQQNIVIIAQPVTSVDNSSLLKISLGNAATSVTTVTSDMSLTNSTVTSESSCLQNLGHVKNSSETCTSSEATATRVIRSLHLTRAQKFHLYLQKDQKRATHPEFSKPFESFKDVIRGLVPFHVFQTREPIKEDIAAVEETFEDKARELLERKDSMLRKYRLLLMEESMRPQLTSEMVLLERTFHGDEKALLTSEKRQAEEDPDSFVPKPVLKRLKLDDEDVKEESDSNDCKHEGIENVTESVDLKIEAASLDENVVKLECSPCPLSLTNTHPVIGSYSVERYKSLQIKLEKLDDSDAELTKCPYKIGKFDSTPRDNQNLLEDNQDESGNNFENSDLSEIPATTRTISCGGFTEDDVAVASLLNTERFNNASCNFQKDYSSKIANETGTSEEHTADFAIGKGPSSLTYPSNADFSNLSYANVADLGTGDISNEQDNDELMQGTIDSLMADLTQFNYDLNNSTWVATESKADVPSGNLRQLTVQNSSLKNNSVTVGCDECSTESLQYEMQCAIDSIIQLQQPWTDEFGTTENLSTCLTTCSAVENEESSVDGCIGKF